MCVLGGEGITEGVSKSMGQSEKDGRELELGGRSFAMNKASEGIAV